MKILITGSDGLVGSSLKQVETNHELIFVNRKDCDLTKEEQVKELFLKYLPESVIHCAAKVGGISFNENYAYDAFYQNLLMNTFVINYAKEFKVKKLLCFSSVCVFPDGLEILTEKDMHEGKPFSSHFFYGYAKRMIDIQIESLKKQYGIKGYCSIIPVNIFGENDRYSEHGHVIPSLIHKLYLAKRDKKPFKVWGNPNKEMSRREFIYSTDLAKILLKIINLDEIPERIIISSRKEISIKCIAEKLCEITNYNNIEWETDKPVGQKSRPTDISLLKSLFDFEFTDFDIALKKSWNWFCVNYPNIRIL